jgi:type I restriction enzyme S subunit
MNAERLLAHFERISEAPDAIARLRRFILDLAVRGKLVEQDPEDEPAAELLKRIAVEKAQLLKAGEIKKEKPLPPIEDAYFDLPRSWTWSRLGKVTSYIQRGKSPKYAVNDGLPVVSQKCVQWSGLDLTVAKQITLESLVDYERIRFLREGDLLWNSTGTGTIGRIIKVVDPLEKLVCDSHVTVVRCLAVVPEYIRAWLRSDHVYALIEHRAAGSTNQVELTAQMAINQIVPLPPLAEQHRIVAKVDELMALCDQLEAARQLRQQGRERLVAATLQRLNQPAADPASFRKDASFALQVLPSLTTTPAQIKQLRQTILNLAVRGKLVEQDPEDEPAEELLSKISQDLMALTLQRRSRSQARSVLTAEEDPFSLPCGWQWVSLDELFRIITDGDHQPPPKASEGVSFLTIGNISGGTIDFNGCRFVPKEYFDSLDEIRRPGFGDILYTVVGASYGRPVIVATERPFCVQRHIAILKPSRLMNSGYLLQLLSSPFVYSQATACLTGTAQPTIPLRPLRNFLAPLPPLAEQHRIVAKVDELMALCDQLEQQLSQADQQRRRLLEALLAEALGARLPTEQEESHAAIA